MIVWVALSLTNDYWLHDEWLFSCSSQGCCGFITIKKCGKQFPNFSSQCSERVTLKDTMWIHCLYCLTTKFCAHPYMMPIKYLKEDYNQTHNNKLKSWGGISTLTCWRKNLLAALCANHYTPINGSLFVFLILKSIKWASWFLFSISA